MNAKVIVTCGIGGWYPAGVERQRQSFYSFEEHQGIDHVGLKHISDARPHDHNHPYDMKPLAIDMMRKRGYKYVLWLDAAVWFNKPVLPIFEIIRKDGYLFPENTGWNTGQWCSDQCLNHFGIDREASFDIPHVMACVLGFDFDNEVIANIFDAYMNDRDKTYPGRWSNDSGEVSADRRVLGHRHDQTALSIYAWQHGLRLQDPTPIIDYGCSKDAILYTRGL